MIAVSKVKVIILRAPGTNCDGETAFAFQQAGAETALVHINRLIAGEDRLANYQIMVVPGGFTYGDDISGGKVLANEMRLKLGDDISKFVTAGGLILGICNGFQVLAKAGILPKFSSNGSPVLTLAGNDSGKFECRWVHLKVAPDSPCIFTRGIERLYVPVAHAEGKVIIDPAAIAKLNVVLRYSDENGKTDVGYPDNPNGSVGNIAGICDDSGRIFTLMPHPERHIRHTQHPQWTRLAPRKDGDGFRIFVNAVKWAEGL